MAPERPAAEDAPHRVARPGVEADGAALLSVGERVRDRVSSIEDLTGRVFVQLFGREGRALDGDVEGSC